MNSPPPPVNHGERHRLYGTALIGAGLLFAYALVKGWDEPSMHQMLVLSSTALAVGPTLVWFRRQPYPFPVFEVFMLTFVPYYSLQIVTEHEAVAMYEEHTVTRALIGVVLFQICAWLSFIATRARPKRGPFWNDPLFTRDYTRTLPAGLWANVFYMWMSNFTDWLPGDIDSVLRAIFFGLATASTFLLGRLWGEGRLMANLKTQTLLALACIAVLQMASLYLITSIATALVFFLAYISAGRKIPVSALVIVFLLMTVMHNGKGPMRVKYWDVGAPQVRLIDLPAYYEEWFTLGLRPFREAEEVPKKRELLERASLLHIMCLVVESTDRGLPFMAGETYGYVLPTFVPRFFWPGKPSGQRTTSRLAIHFGLQDEFSAQTTSIGFGVIAEAYANFGYFGLILLGGLIGCSNKVLCVWTRHAPLLSNGGLLMILLMAWAIQAEMPMSSWVSSLYQAVMCMLGIPYVFKRLLN